VLPVASWAQNVEEEVRLDGIAPSVVGHGQGIPRMVDQMLKGARSAQVAVHDTLDRTVLSGVGHR
jgi:hypothetical protein